MSPATDPVPDVLERITEGFLATDPRGSILRVNRRLEAMFGYERGELVGKPLGILIPESLRIRHEDHHASFIRHPSNRSMGSGLDLVGRRKDGSEFPIEVSLTSATERGAPLAYALVSDITQRKEAEKLLEEERSFTSVVLETLGALVVILDTEGRVVRFNRACQETTGYTFAEVEGRLFWDLLLLPEEIADVRATFDRLLAGDFPWKQENHWRTKTGESRLISWSNTAIVDPAGVPRHVVGTGIDITERKQLEQQYLQAQKMEAIGRLAGGVAHDFNNVLSVISFDTEMLMDQLEDDTSRELLEEMSRVIDRGASIVRELLNFSRPQVATPVVVDLNLTLAESTRMLRVLVGETVDIEVVTHGEPARTELEGGQIEQILMNLAANSRDAMPEGGRLRFEVSEAHIDRVQALLLGVDPGDYVTLRATDSGCGIDETIMDHIFEPFFTTKKVGKGTGLGLSTTYGIVTGAGGAITCQNEKAGGATFTVHLPKVSGNRE